jgi:23S rRNA (uracil1939-C5)-methyltransferase
VSIASEIIRTEGITNTGGCIATLKSGKKVFVESALPGELVRAEITAEFSSYCIAQTTEVLEASEFRAEALDSEYAATSPWQIVQQDYENELKQDLIRDAYHGVAIPTQSIPAEAFSAREVAARSMGATPAEAFSRGVDFTPPVHFAGDEYFYRNKFTYALVPLAPSPSATGAESSTAMPTRRTTSQAFSAREVAAPGMISSASQAYSPGAAYALGVVARHSGEATPASSFSLPAPAINQAARIFIDALNAPLPELLPALESAALMVRCNRAGEALIQLQIASPTGRTASQTSYRHLADALFQASQEQAVLVKYFEVAQMKAGRKTKVLYKRGLSELHDELLGKTFAYDVDSFFQVNLPAFEEALKKMQTFVLSGKPVVDLYSGVGSIGINLADPDQKLVLVEVEKSAAKFARQNLQRNRLSNAQVYAVHSEMALQYIERDATLSIDPPRKGLHRKIIDRILEVQPQRIIYLSCSPITQARDIKHLTDGDHAPYRLIHLEGYNFFPKTPHVESLAVLERA